MLLHKLEIDNKMRIKESKKQLCGLCSAQSDTEVVLAYCNTTVDPKQYSTAASQSSGLFPLTVGIRTST